MLAASNWHQLSLFQCREFVLLKETVPLQASDDTSMQTLLSKVNLLLKDLVEKTFLVNKQPPQILKKDSKFSVSARHLGKLWFMRGQIPLRPLSLECQILNSDNLFAAFKRSL